jgi:hypothetical protein
MSSLVRASDVGCAIALSTDALNVFEKCIDWDRAVVGASANAITTVAAEIHVFTIVSALRHLTLELTRAAYARTFTKRQQWSGVAVE